MITSPGPWHGAARVLTTLVPFVLAGPASAAWLSNGAPVCSAAGNQFVQDAAPDGAGGTIVAWEDYRSGSAADIYAQRLDPSGAPLWAADGIAICVASGTQQFARIEPDGAGGAVIVWNDGRNSAVNRDLYAQRVDSSGIVQWLADGVPVCTAAGRQDGHEIVGDGSGGVIVSWWDLRNGDFDIYAQRLDSTGAPLWTADGVAACTASGVQFDPFPVTDDSGGVFVTWQDARGADEDIYMQRITSAGVAAWVPDGVPVCALPGYQYQARGVPDGTGGAIIAWGDVRGLDGDAYAQRIDSSGTAQWSTDGVPLSSATGDQSVADVAPDGSGGAIVAWMDSRFGVDNVYVQRIDASGTVLWTADGAPVCVDEGGQSSVRMAAAASGVTLAWMDFRNGSDYDLYVQHVDASGGVQWTVDGAPLCTAQGDQESPTLVPDGSGEVIVIWQDYRGGLGETDVYALVPGAAPTSAGVPAPPAAFLSAAPNPFRQTTELRFVLPRPARATLAVHDAGGRLVRMIESRSRTAGWHSVAFDGRDQSGRALPNGVYFARLNAGPVAATYKVILVR